MTPIERDELDETVAKAKAEGWSQAHIAEVLEVTRDTVRASLKRIARAQAPTTQALAKVDANASADADMASIARLLSEVEDAIGAATAMNDSASASRWARARQALLAGQRERLRLAQAARDAEAANSTEDWTRLNDAEAQMLIALTRRLNGEEPTSFDARALRALEGPRAPEPKCSTCYLEPEHTPREWLCDACAEQVRAMRARVPVARDGERALGAAPTP